MSGRLRLVTNTETSAADSLASTLAVDADSLASQKSNPPLVPVVSPGSAGSTGTAAEKHCRKRLDLDSKMAQSSILVTRPEPQNASVEQPVQM